jgi:tRNA dimethylallyltransferase
MTSSSQPNLPKIIIVLGPTASGKSDLAVFLARRYGGEIISADSRQVYKGLDIGSGKITEREMYGVPHYLLDVASPKRIFSVERYKRLAERAIRDILKRGKLPIICGGTAQYINAVLYDHDFPAVKPNMKLRNLLEKKSTEELFAMLQEKDPVRAASIDRHNPRRLIRALEIIISTNKPILPLAKNPQYTFLKIGITRSDEVLRKRIHDRLLKRMRQGMLKEVEKLHGSGLSWKRLDDLGLEYRFISRYLRNLISREDMLSQLEIAIWHYTKRQMTWWKHDKEIHWITNEKEALLLTETFMR